MSAAERAAAELEDFARRAHADVDPHAPPAMKASPSVSGGEDDGAGAGALLFGTRMHSLCGCMHACSRGLLRVFKCVSCWI
jgi:hypothetical protein